MARLRTILHEQGRQIDELRLESAGYKQRIASLEQCLEEEMTRRQASSPQIWKISLQIFTNIVIHKYFRESTSP